MICDRCGSETLVHTTSWFNTQRICTTCSRKESVHPKFKEAKDADTAAVLRGDYNFVGIGLPPDLK